MTRCTRTPGWKLWALIGERRQRPGGKHVFFVARFKLFGKRHDDVMMRESWNGSCIFCIRKWKPTFSKCFFLASHWKARKTGQLLLWTLLLSKNPRKPSSVDLFLHQKKWQKATNLSCFLRRSSMVFASALNMASTSVNFSFHFRLERKCVPLGPPLEGKSS